MPKILYIYAFFPWSKKRGNMPTLTLVLTDTENSSQNNSSSKSKKLYPNLKERIKLLFAYDVNLNKKHKE